MTKIQKIVIGADNEHMCKMISSKNNESFIVVGNLEDVKNVVSHPVRCAFFSNCKYQGETFFNN